MKIVLFRSVFCLTFIFLTSIAFAQDIIILKNGDEIKSKVIEITPDFVKYKNWANQEGPIYSSNKSEVFMIKYANGTKDVFNTAPVTNSNSTQISNVNKNITVTDIDGNVYKTITIGTQTWMVENLKTTKYRNGDPIPNITHVSQWYRLTTGAQCNYNNDAAIDNKYGKLYNWYAVSDGRNIAPTGWHVPTDAEWTTLENYVAANLGTSGSMAKALASKTDWSSSTDAGAVGNDLTKNNTSGFTALPSGNLSDSGAFGNVGGSGNWWSSSEHAARNAWYRDMHYSSGNVERGNYNKAGGFSVRCLRDN